MIEVKSITQCNVAETPYHSEAAVFTLGF